MNAWAIIVLALGAGVLFWAAKQKGGLSELGTDLDLAGLAALAAKGSTNIGTATGSAGDSADKGSSTEGEGDGDAIGDPDVIP